MKFATSLQGYLAGLVTPTSAQMFLEHGHILVTSAACCSWVYISGGWLAPCTCMCAILCTFNWASSGRFHFFRAKKL